MSKADQFTELQIFWLLRVAFCEVSTLESSVSEAGSDAGLQSIFYAAIGELNVLEAAILVVLKITLSANQQTRRIRKLQFTQSA